jgi:hypothetical protein
MGVLLALVVAQATALPVDLILLYLDRIVIAALLAINKIAHLHLTFVISAQQAAVIVHLIMSAAVALLNSSSVQEYAHARQPMDLDK